MKNKKLILVGLLILWLMISVVQRRIIDLGDNFSYIPYQEEVFDVTTFGEDGIYLIKDNKKTPVVLPDIKDYKYDSEYIIVKQKFDLKETSKLVESCLSLPNIYFNYDKTFIPLDENYLSTLNQSANNSGYYEKFAIELLTKSSFVKKMETNKENFFIIHKKSQKLFGPFTKSEFGKFKQNHNLKLDF